MFMRDHDNHAGRECGSERRGDCRHGCRCGHGREDLAGKLEYCGRVLGQFAGRHRAQRKILRILREQGPISQKELQEILGIQSGSMSEIAAKLESRGLIARGRDQADKRKITLSITEKGLEWVVQRDGEGIRQRRAELFSALTEEERGTLEALLDKLAADWIQRMELEQRDGSPQDQS